MVGLPKVIFLAFLFTITLAVPDYDPYYDYGNNRREKQANSEGEVTSSDQVGKGATSETPVDLKTNEGTKNPSRAPNYDGAQSDGYLTYDRAYQNSGPTSTKPSDTRVRSESYQSPSSGTISDYSRSLRGSSYDSSDSPRPVRDSSRPASGTNYESSSSPISERSSSYDSRPLSRTSLESMNSQRPSRGTSYDSSRPSDSTTYKSSNSRSPATGYVYSRPASGTTYRKEASDNPRSSSDVEHARWGGSEFFGDSADEYPRTSRTTGYAPIRSETATFSTGNRTNIDSNVRPSRVSSQGKGSINGETSDNIQRADTFVLNNGYGATQTPKATQMGTRYEPTSVSSDHHHAIYRRSAAVHDKTLRRIRRGGYGYVGPVYTYVKTDYDGNFKWGARHLVGKKYGGHGGGGGGGGYH